MSLILVPGASGSGKSHTLFKAMLKEANEHPDRRYIVLVPEQNTLQTQKDLTAMSERGGILNIDVLSFTRLAYRVFEQTGVAKRQILSETGKVLLLRLIASREGDKLPLLKGILDRPGMLSELKSILSEMDQYGIDSGKLDEMRRSLQGEGAREGLLRKLSEIALLQETFERYQADHFITGEKLPRVLCEKAPLDVSLKGTKFLLDGFTGFTPAQLEVIKTLLGIAGDIMVTVTIDPEELMYGGRLSLDAVMAEHPSDHELFALSKRTIQSLVHCAQEAGAQVDLCPAASGTRKRHRAGGELEWLEAHLLRPGAAGRLPYRGGPDTVHEIYFRQCADPGDEAVSAAVTISELAKQGMRYREMAIVCGSLKDYAEYMRRELSVYQIPYFIDQSSTVVMNPAFEFIRSAISVPEKNFSYESVMALLRTGLALDPESGEIDSLENYILAAGIRGHRAWQNPFTRQTRRNDPDQMNLSETARVSFMEHFEPFAQVMKKSTEVFHVYAEAVWNLLCAFDVPKKLARWSERYQEEGLADKAQEYATVLRVISQVLDEAALLMGDEKVTRTQFAQILQAGFTEAKIGILPRGIDQVQVGDLERSRLEHIRVIFFVGFNDGFVPRRKVSGSVLTDIEREYLRDHKIRLAPTAREDASIQQFYLYRTLTRPSWALYLSWSMSKRSGEEMRPSHVLRSIRDMFPGAEWVSAASAAPFESVTSLRTGISVMAQGLSDCLHMDKNSPDWIGPKLKELMKLYRRHQEEMNRQTLDEAQKRAWEETQKRAWESSQEKTGEGAQAQEVEEAQSQILSGSQNQDTEEIGKREQDEIQKERALACLRMLAPQELPRLSEEIALELYGKVLRGSITRLEDFSECAFRHFADYGLGLKEREEFTVQTLDIGNLLHGAMEILSRRLKDDPGTGGWRGIDDDRRDQLARESLKEALARQHGEELYSDTRRSEGILERCEQILLRSAKTIQKQIKAGDFEPAFFELSFGKEKDSVLIENLPGGRSMQLQGKIDRIDECDDEKTGKLYVKIVDYKSSSHDFDLDGLIEGEQLQLMVYMDEAARMEAKNHPDREIVCAGVFYFAFQDPVIDMTFDMTQEAMEDAVVGEMKVSGLVNGSPDVIDHLDRDLPQSKASLVIPVRKNKEPGSLRASRSIVDQEKIDLLRRYSRDRMRRISEAILAGEIAPNPSRKDERTSACTYCPYKDLCRFDPHSKTMSYRERTKLDDTQKWELIRKALDPQENTSDSVGESPASAGGVQ